MKNEKSIDSRPLQSNEMPLKDSLFLSPIEKYKIYGRFPWKMVIHILLVIATTVQAIMTISERTQYTRSQERILYNMFISDSDKTDVDFARKTYLFSVSDLRDHLNNSVNNYYSFQSDSLEIVEYPNEKSFSSFKDDNHIYHADKEQLYVNMFISYYFTKAGDSADKQYYFRVNQTSLGPFDQDDKELKAFLNSVKNFVLEYRFKTYVPFFFGDNFECFKWKVIQNYDFIHRAHFVASLNIYRSSCTDKTDLTFGQYFINQFMWLHMLIIVLAFSSLMLTWKHFYKMAKIYWRLKRKSKEKRKKTASIEYNENDYGDPSIDINSNINSNNDINPDPNTSLPFSENINQNNNVNIKIDSSDKRKLTPPENDHNINTNTYPYDDHKPKLKFFNKWSLICLLGNIIQIFGSSLSLFDNEYVLSSTEILVGFSCMLAYINVGRYLEYNRDYSTIFATIKCAIPNVLRYLLGVMPIFFGFIFFGLCLFWRSERFINTSSTMMTLFAMLNGDSVWDIFHDLSGVSFFIGQMYCYIFCIIFIVVVMNVFISIIEEAYVSTKMRNQNHWIYSYLKIDPNYIKIKDVGEAGNEIDDHGDLVRKEDGYEEKVMTKEKSKLLKSITSKNILREAVSFSGDKTSKKIEDNKENKENIEKLIESHFVKVSLVIICICVGLYIIIYYNIYLFINIYQH